MVYAFGAGLHISLHPILVGMLWPHKWFMLLVQGFTSLCIQSQLACFGHTNGVCTSTAIPLPLHITRTLLTNSACSCAFATQMAYTSTSLPLSLSIRHTYISTSHPLSLSIRHTYISTSHPLPLHNKHTLLTWSASI